MMTVVTELCPDMRLSVLKPLRAQWVMKAIANIKSNPKLIFQGWESAGIFSELQQLHSEVDGVPPPQTDGVQDQLSSQSYRLSGSTLDSIVYLFNRFSPVHEHFLGPEGCQSFLDGRKGSNACTVIACLAAKQFFSGGLDLPAYQNLSDHSINQLSDAYIHLMREANSLYDKYVLIPWLPYLSVSEAVQLCRCLELQISSNGELDITDVEDSLARITSCFADNPQMPAGVFTANSCSVTLLFKSSGDVIILDSRSHGNERL